MFKKKVVNLVGIGGHARSVADLLFSEGFEIESYYDDNGNVNEHLLNKVKFGGKIKDIPDDKHLVLAIGDNIKRKDLYDRKNIYTPPIIHSSANVNPNSSIGNGTLIFSGANICVEVSIGKNCIINTYALIEHESKIGNHCHISIGSILAGRVSIGDICFIGAGAIIKDKVNITSNVVIGAGAVVTQDIFEPGTYIGIPAVKMN